MIHEEEEKKKGPADALLLYPEIKQSNPERLARSIYDNDGNDDNDEIFLSVCLSVMVMEMEMI